MQLIDAAVVSGLAQQMSEQARKQVGSAKWRRMDESRRQAAARAALAADPQGAAVSRAHLTAPLAGTKSVPDKAGASPLLRRVLSPEREDLSPQEVTQQRAGALRTQSREQVRRCDSVPTLLHHIVHAASPVKAGTQGGTKHAYEDAPSSQACARSCEA